MGSACWSEATSEYGQYLWELPFFHLFLMKSKVINIVDAASDYLVGNPVLPHVS